MITKLNVESSVRLTVVSATVILGLIFYRKYRVRRWGHCKSKKSLKGQVVIVTGANSGLGKAAAVELAERGARIILACRDVGKGREAVNEIIRRVPTCSADDLTVFQLDLSSFKSVRKFVDEFCKTNSALDILVNNAGVMACCFAPTEDGVDSQMAVNHYGSFLLTNLLLEKSSPSRIIFVTSLLAKKGNILLERADPLSYNKREAYANSKLSNYVYAVELSRRLGPRSATGVYLVSPGHVWTNLGRHLKPSWWKLLLMWPILIPLAYLFVKTPSQGCQTIIYCAVEDGLENGGFYRNCQAAPHPKDIAKHQHLATSLWDHSQMVTGEIQS